MGGHLAVAEYFAPKMGDHFFDFNDGYSALHWAAQEGQLSVVEYLMRSCGFDVKAIDKVATCYLSDASCDLSGTPGHSRQEDVSLGFVSIFCVFLMLLLIA